VSHSCSTLVWSIYAQADAVHLATELAPEPEAGKGKRARKPTAKQGDDHEDRRGQPRVAPHCAEP
jgi:hypothetical protein